MTACPATTTTCPYCLQQLPRRPGNLIHGPVSHVCNFRGEARPVVITYSHPVQVSPTEQADNLAQLQL